MPTQATYSWQGTRGAKQLATTSWRTTSKAATAASGVTKNGMNRLSSSSYVNKSRTLGTTTKTWRGHTT